MHRYGMKRIMMDDTFAPPQPHSEIKEIFPDIFFVTGSVRMAGPLPIAFSRNMIILRHEGSLTLINSLRLDEVGLSALDTLGTVEHVIRLAGFHGMDDPFYKHRYGAKIWVVKGHVYARGFQNPRTEAKDGYFQPDVYMDETTELPMADGKLLVFDCRAGEGLLALKRHGGIVISGDILQNWQSTDRYFSLVGKVMMRVLGFIKPHNIGPGWLKQAKPDLTQIKGILALDFEHVLPVHGEPVIGGARDKYRPAIERVAG